MLRASPPPVKGGIEGPKEKHFLVFRLKYYEAGLASGVMSEVGDSGFRYVLQFYSSRLGIQRFGFCFMSQGLEVKVLCPKPSTVAQNLMLPA